MLEENIIWQISTFSSLHCTHRCHLAPGPDTRSQHGINAELYSADLCSSNRTGQKVCRLTFLSKRGWEGGLCSCTDYRWLQTLCNSDKTSLLLQISLIINNELKDCPTGEILMTSPYETLLWEREAAGVLVGAILNSSLISSCWMFEM